MRENDQGILIVCRFKDRINCSQQSRIIYKANCWDCILVFKLVKPNDGFVIGKPNILRPQLLLTTQKPLDITSTGITLIFWRTAKQTTIAKSETLFIQELEPAFNVNFGSEKLMLH